MQVILVEDVYELGKRGQVLNVAAGYGRNYLIPKGLALPATAGNLKTLEQQRLALAKKEAKHFEEAQLLTQELNQLHLIVSRKAGESGSLFGSVTAKDLGQMLALEGIHIDRRRILLSQPIKSIGNFEVSVRPHSDVEAQLLVSVMVEGEEPVARVKRKDEESDRIVAEINAKVKEMGLAAEGRTVGEPEEAKEAPEEGSKDSQARAAEEARAASQSPEEEPTGEEHDSADSEAEAEADSEEE